VEVSFIGGGNRITQRKPLTCCKSLTNDHITADIEIQMVECMNDENININILQTTSDKQ
jgi:hypothetical protein